MTARRRRKLGYFSDFASRYRVYETDSAIEVDELDNFEVTRKRVFFEDVLLVTIHQRVGVTGLVISSILGFMAIAVAAAIGGKTGMWYAAVSAPLFLYALLRLLMKERIVTIFGRRSKAKMRFIFRKGKARAIFDHICASVRAAQERLGEEIRAADAANAPAEAEVPMPPDMAQ